MRNVVLSGALFAALPVSAEDTTVIPCDGSAGVAVHHRVGVVERREVATGSVDCGSKTVHKEGCN